MAKQEFSVPALMKRLASEHDAYLLLEELRWGSDPVCHHCGTIGGHYYIRPANGVTRKTRTGTLSQRRVWKCAACRKQFSVLTGTIFHGTKIPVRTWVLVIAEVCSSKNGISAREVERKYDLTAKTAWFMLQRIREAMKRDPLNGLLNGTIVADETWIGGEPRFRHASKRAGGKQGRTDKTPVLALIQRETGEVRSRVVADVTARSLRAAIAEQVDTAGSDLNTDSATAYNTIGDEFRTHGAVDHSSGEYVRGGVTSNEAENYFSQLKRSLDGTHHHVSVEHLGRYLAHFDFLYTYCKAMDSDRVRVLLSQVAGRRLTYKPLTSG